jgi:hypothetical protein
MQLLSFRTGEDLWIVIRIDEESAIKFPATWWDAFKEHWLWWFPGIEITYSKPYRRWHMQGLYSDEQKACESCQDENWFYFPFMLNVAYPLERVEVQAVFPLRDNARYSLRKLW